MDISTDTYIHTHPYACNIVCARKSNVGVQQINIKGVPSHNMCIYLSFSFILFMKKKRGRGEIALM